MSSEGFEAQWVGMHDVLGGFTEGLHLKSKNPPPPDLPEEPPDPRLLAQLERLGFLRSQRSWIFDPSPDRLLLLLED